MDDVDEVDALDEKLEADGGGVGGIGPTLLPALLGLPVAPGGCGAPPPYIPGVVADA